MKNYLTISLAILVCFGALNVRSQGQMSPDETLEMHKKYYQFPTNGNYREAAQDLIVSFQLQLPERDSLLQKFYERSVPKTEIDTAIHEFVLAYDNYFSYNYKEAIPHFEKSKFLFLKNDLEGPAIAPRISLAAIRYYMKDVKGAFEDYQAIFDDNSSNEYEKARMANNIGALYMEVEDDNWNSPNPSPRREFIRSEIEKHFQYSIDFANKTRNLTAAAGTYSVWINFKLGIDRYDEAIALTDSSLRMSRLLGDSARLAFTRIKQCAILDSLGQGELALDTIQEAIDYFISVGNYNQQQHAMGKKAAMLQKLDRKDEAISELLAMQDIFKEKINSELSDASAKYDKYYESSIKELEIKDQKLSIANRNRWLLLSGGIILVLFLSSIILIERNKRKAQKEKEALIIDNQKASLTSIITAQEDERKRIAKDLHDGIVQKLGGLMLGMQKLFESNPTAESNQLINILDESAQELRDLSHSMMPKALSELGLVPAIEDMLEKSIGLGNIKYEFEHFGVNSRPSENIEITIYRITQELINNVIKHSQATKVNIQLFQAGNDIVLIIEDNGLGFQNEKKKKPGIGLMNIHSRLDTVNGKVNFNPSPESGTLVTVKIPLQ